MEPRIDYMKAGRGALEAMLGLEKYIRQSGFEESLLTLVRMRASQINAVISRYAVFARSNFIWHVAQKVRETSC